MAPPTRPPGHSGQKKGLAPTLSMQPRTLVSVEEWEAKAPLGELEIRSINFVKEATERAHSVLDVCSLSLGVYNSATYSAA